MEAGTGRRALEAYNDALQHAAAERWGEARASLQDVRAVLPDFTPAAILLGLAHIGEGRTAAARSVWAEAASRSRDHPELRRLLSATPPESGRATGRPRSYWPYAAVTVATIGLVGLIAVSQTSGGGSDPEDSPQEEFALNRATPSVDTPEGGPPQVPAVEVAEGAAPGVEPAPVVERDPAVTAVRYDVAWGLFEEAREQSATGDWAAAVPRLVIVDELAPGRFYHDDALYLLARGYAIRGSKGEARTVAEALLTRYPESIFANSVTRAIVETGQHP